MHAACGSIASTRAKRQEDSCVVADVRANIEDEVFRLDELAIEGAHLQPLLPSPMDIHHLSRQAI